MATVDQQLSEHIPGGTPEWYSTKFYTGRRIPEVQPLTLLHTIFDRKGTSFVDLLLTIGAPFIYWNSVSPLNAVCCNPRPSFRYDYYSFKIFPRF